MTASDLSAQAIRLRRAAVQLLALVALTQESPEAASLCHALLCKVRREG